LKKGGIGQCVENCGKMIGFMEMANGDEKRRRREECSPLTSSGFFLLHS
jgi:hypothetical protein